MYQQSHLVQYDILARIDREERIRRAEHQRAVRDGRKRARRQRRST